MSYQPFQIFVFGSNLAGRHGKGAALYALKNCGAEPGNGRGLQGHSYAIPTKDEQLRVLDREMIKGEINLFLEFVREHPEMEFYLTPVGTGLAGYSSFGMRSMFGELPDNVKLADTWEAREPDEDF